MAKHRFTFELVVEGLVHVGDGTFYTGAEYLIKEGKPMQAGVVNMDRLAGLLTPVQIDAYSRFLEGADSSKNLNGFIQNHRDLEDKVLRSVEYWVETPIKRVPRGDWKAYSVSAFVKDAYSCPFIPASSFKGMLRTVLLTAIIQRDPLKYQSLFGNVWQEWEERGKPSVSSKNGLKDAPIVKAAFVEEKRVGSTEYDVNVMRFISVADSKPLSTNDLVFAQKFDEFAATDDASHKRNMGNTNRDIAEGNELNIYRECLKRGTHIEFQVDVDDEIIKHLPWLELTQEGLQKLFSEFYDLYTECFVDYFPRTESKNSGVNVSLEDDRCRYIAKDGPLEGMRCRNRAQYNGFCAMHQDQAASSNRELSTPNEAYCLLGGGVDFDSKTVINAIFANQNDERLRAICEILYVQFPSRIVSDDYKGLQSRIEDAGFKWRPMKERPRGKKIQRKDDHRHWRDQELGVAPHTMKYGLVGDDKFPMGKCAITTRSNR